MLDLRFTTKQIEEADVGKLRRCCGSIYHQVEPSELILDDPIDVVTHVSRVNDEIHHPVKVLSGMVQPKISGNSFEPLDTNSVEYDKVHKQVCTKPPKVVKLSDPDLNYNLVKTFYETRCIPNESMDHTTKRIVFQAFQDHCLDRNRPAPTHEEFEKFMFKCGAHHIKNEFGDECWKGLEIHNVSAMRSPYSIMIETKCHELKEVFPNITVKRCIPLVRALMRVTNNSTLQSIDTVQGKIISFDELAVLDKNIEILQNE